MICAFYLYIRKITIRYYKLATAETAVTAVEGEGVMVVMLVRVSTEVAQPQNPLRWVRYMR
jgi:hypothetical protein